MKHDIAILPKAWECLKAIEDYYSIEFSVEVAIKVSDSILDAIGRLEDFPDSGSETPDPYLNNMGFQMVIIKHHVAIYRLIDKIVYIYFIADAKTNYTKLLWRMISNPDQ